jgi:hypothetical protein
MIYIKTIDLNLIYFITIYEIITIIENEYVFCYNVFKINGKNFLLLIFFIINIKVEYF